VSSREYAEVNREAWNEVAPIHRAHNFERLAASFRRPGFSCLDPIETAILREIGVVGADVAQLGCNNGRELLSMRNLGAARCVGFDIADAFIAEAKELAAIAGQNVAFVRTSHEDVPGEYDGAFDIVVITIGVLPWVADLAAFYRVVARLLRPGGRFFAYESHPVLWIFDPAADGRALAFTHPYFETTPFFDAEGLDYYGDTTYVSRTKVEFQHTLGDVLQGAIDAGLAIRRFREYPHDISNRFRNLADTRYLPPMCYTLVAEKGA
jgi:SAM-dependent methyltransferase